MLSLGVVVPTDIHVKRNRTYFVWEHGKAPEVVIEVVSNREGGEDTEKLVTYAEIGIRLPAYLLVNCYQLLGIRRRSRFVTGSISGTMA
jgi:Uma2 family endonuclease